MREYFVEHDVIAAEVQSLYADGACALHRVKFGSKVKWPGFYLVLGVQCLTRPLTPRVPVYISIAGAGSARILTE
jgi:hypothetical protein